MDTLKIDLWGMSATASGEHAIIALTLIVLALVALHFLSRTHRKG